MSKINLFIPWYYEANEIRAEELMFCLRQNIDNPLIDHIYLISETTIQPIEHEKVTFIVKNHRATYKDMFNIANEVNGIDDISLISNTDIYFHPSLNLLHEYLLQNVCFAIFRHEKGKKYKYQNCTQDVWIFKGEINQNIYSDFCLGIPGCDNRIAFEIERAGYRLYSPSREIIVFHHHISNIRHYVMWETHGVQEYLKQRIPPPHRFLFCDTLEKYYKKEMSLRKNISIEQDLELKKDAYQNIELCNVVADKTLVLKNEKRHELDMTNKFLTIGILYAKIMEGLNTITVLDFGGACGAHYYQIRNGLKDLNIKWIIVETEQMIKSAKSRNLDSEELVFQTDLKNLTSIDLIHVSSGLEYTLKPYETLQKLLELNTKYFVFNRLVFTEFEERFIQKSRLSANGHGPLPNGYIDKTIEYPKVTMVFSKFMELVQKDYIVKIDNRNQIFCIRRRFI